MTTDIMINRVGKKGKKYSPCETDSSRGLYQMDGISPKRRNKTVSLLTLNVFVNVINDDIDEVFFKRKKNVLLNLNLLIIIFFLIYIEEEKKKILHLNNKT